ncbi:hypothetical protein G9A89_010363 [Geosiphon pyriformis]|nr:hypothetical protein G9A89_010363 [Geosiphon pyriformis]
MGACCGDNEEYSTATKFYCHTIAIAKIEGTSSEEIRKIKNNPPEPIKLDWNPKPVINLLNSEQFHEHYQGLVSTREEQKQCLEQLNTQLSSSTQYDNKNNNNLDSDLNPKTYITLTDLTKKQELKWFSDNNEDIMPEHAHNTNAEFDLRYLGKDPIKLEPNLHICIDLKIVLEIPATTIVQLASKSSLAKKGINIRGEIINTGYIRNIIAMLQNDSEKAYIIDLNKKIAQTIFLPLVKIAQLVLVGNKEELGIITKKIQGFRSIDKIDIPVNMAEKEVIDKGEIISNHQSISISPYDQYMLAIKREVKNQAQLFEAEATICESGEIGLTNLYILAKSPKNIKILIYNTTGSVIKIPKGIIIGYLTTKVEDQPPNHIPDFSQLCGYVDITLQIIYE